MTEAARGALVVRDGWRALQGFEAEDGPLTDEEMDDARVLRRIRPSMNSELAS